MKIKNFTIAVSFSIVSACSQGGDAESIYGNATGGNAGSVTVSPETEASITASGSGNPTTNITGKEDKDAE